jgi:hypothetical protein
MDVVGGFALAHDTHARALIGIDGLSRIVCSGDGSRVHQRGLATGLDPVGLSPADAARGMARLLGGVNRMEPRPQRIRGPRCRAMLVGRQVVIAFSSIMVGIRQDLPGSGGGFQQVKHAAPQRNTGGNPGVNTLD